MTKVSRQKQNRKKYNEGGEREACTWGRHFPSCKYQLPLTVKIRLYVCTRSWQTLFRSVIEVNLSAIEANLAENRCAFYVHFLSVKRSSLIAPSFYGPPREWNLFSRTPGGNRLKVRAFRWTKRSTVQAVLSFVRWSRIATIPQGFSARICELGASYTCILDVKKIRSKMFRSRRYKINV